MGTTLHRRRRLPAIRHPVAVQEGLTHNMAARISRAAYTKKLRR
jgi:hypothetical protein